MGPNGSGKSTLSSVIAGDENYEVESGSIMLNGEDLLEMDPDERAHKGVFLSFQYPVEIQNRLYDELESKVKNFNIDQKMNAVMQFSLDEITDTAIFVNFDQKEIDFLKEILLK